jgi:hypothetical protein
MVFAAFLVPTLITAVWVRPYRKGASAEVVNG